MFYINYMISSVSVGELQKKTSLFRSSSHPFLVRDGRKKNTPLSLVIPLQNIDHIPTEKDILEFLHSYTPASFQKKRTFTSLPGFFSSDMINNILNTDEEIESMFYDSPLFP